MLMEVAGKQLYFQAVSRSGKTIDKGTIAQLDTHPGKDVVESPGAPKKNQPPAGTPAPPPAK